MNTFHAVVSLFTLLPAFASVACHGAVPPEAQPAAEAWLGLVDAGRYAESWTEASSYFKGAVDSKTWEHQVAAVRGPLGQLESRKLKSAQHVTSLPGAPDGDYVVFQFDAAFQRKTTAVETVTVSKEPDATWRAAGYYIK